jgi:predicted nucleotidyltransferase
MENLNHLLKRLLESKIDFVLIGGYAAVLHGSSQVTQDIDICAVISDANLEELRTTLRDLDPKHRMNPNFQPSLMDYPAKGQKIDNYYLRTRNGILDIIQEVRPIGSFERIRERAVTVSLFGRPCRVISLDDLIEVKKSMTRPKDKTTLKELELLKRKTKS